MERKAYITGWRFGNIERQFSQILSKTHLSILAFPDCVSQSYSDGSQLRIRIQLRSKQNSFS